MRMELPVNIMQSPPASLRTRTGRLLQRLHRHVVQVYHTHASICLQELPTGAALAKLSATLKRVCCPKAASGRLDVNPEIYKQWLAGGDSRRVLLKLLFRCDGKKAC